MEAFSVWSPKALCVGMPDYQFYGDNKQQSARWIEENLPCSACPVKKDCYDYAIIYDEDGIWGGVAKQARNRHAKAIRDSLVHEAIDLGILETHREPRDQILHDYLLLMIAKNYRMKNPTRSQDLKDLLGEVYQLTQQLEQVLPQEPQCIPIAHTEADSDSSLDLWLQELETYIQHCTL